MTTPIEPTSSKKHDAIVVGSGAAGGMAAFVLATSGAKAGAENIQIGRDPLTPGWSIHELGTARMGEDPKASVVNSFGQTHDVKNLFVVDGSIFVSAGNQNPTWTILALSMRCTSYLAEELKKGNV